jgi:hypothetical protein
MLKTVSSIANSIGALNYKGTWDANANSPALASSVGTKGDYYVVGTAGSTNLNGISNWGIGDWAAFNGSVWQRVEGGANLNGVDLSVSGTSTLSGLTASTALALNASKEVVSVTNTGTGNNVLATSPTIATPSISGSATMTGGTFVNNSTAGTHSFDIQGNQVSMATGATVDFANFSGLIIVNCFNIGSNTIYITGAGVITQVATVGAPQGTVTFNPGANGYTFTNTSGATFIFSFYALRTRPAA